MDLNICQILFFKYILYVHNFNNALELFIICGENIHDTLCLSIHFLKQFPTEALFRFHRLHIAISVYIKKYAMSFTMSMILKCPVKFIGNTLNFMFNKIWREDIVCWLNISIL